MNFRCLVALLVLCGTAASALAQAVLRNDRYSLDVAADGTVTMRVTNMPPQAIVPEFTVISSARDPKVFRNFNHPNYPIAPRPAVRWLGVNEPTDTLNAWLASPAMKAAVAWSAKVIGEGEQRMWEYRDKFGKVTLRVGGRSRDGATRPFAVGENTVVRATKSRVVGDSVEWVFAANDNFSLGATLRLPKGDADPELTFTFTPKRSAFYSVAFTGAPVISRKEWKRTPQECAGRGNVQGDFVLSEADLKLPRAFTATSDGCVAVVADPRECRFRLPTLEDSRFGMMLVFAENDSVKPVLLAPLLGGAESKMKANAPWSFTLRIAARAGDWAEMHRHIARDIHGLLDQRDNSGPGSLNAALEHIMDFLADRNGRNYAMWSDEQKYYDYFTDQTGVFKPFSPLYGLSAAIVTDDETFYLRRARPAVEFALSRKYNLFAPYEGIYEAIVKSAASDVGGPYPGYAQLMSLHELLQRRSPVVRSLAETKGAQPKDIADQLARWRLTGDRAALDAALKNANAILKSGSGASEQALFDFLELSDATRDGAALRGVIAAAYARTADFNLYPAPPDERLVVDAGGFAPVHKHSFGRHKNIWGFPAPQPVATPEQSVPAWRVSRLGLPSPAYPMEYWMNAHAALLRVSALSGDDFLRDVARNGMVGRFGNYPGDNRSVVSLIGEQSDAVETPPWQWNFATVNPGHAWDFAGAVMDFLVTEAFARSRGAIDFPAVNAAGSGFRVRIYGSAAGEFFGDKGAHLWLPRGLVDSDNRQLDWIAAHGNGQLYLALMNQSVREERVTVAINRDLAECRDGDARCWRNNQSVAPMDVSGNSLAVTVPAKGMVALAIPAKVKPRMQAKLYAADAPALPERSFVDVTAPFGRLHAMLLTAGRGLSSAFVYAEAHPENVIAARLRWRQGDGPWREQVDAIFPYEFSPELVDGAGDFQCVFEIENAQQKLQRAPLITLPVDRAGVAGTSEAPPASSQFIAANLPSMLPPAEEFRVDADLFEYFKTAANPKNLGLRNGRFFPYSTPLGRRIAWGLPVWDKALFEKGCTPAEAEARLRAELALSGADLKRVLAARQPAVVFEKLDRRQHETLLDFALTGGAARISGALLDAVLAGDWSRMVRDHLYVRYAGPAPDHARNKAFAQRWEIP